MRGSRRQIDDAPTDERTAVIDDHDDGLPGPRVCHGQSGAEGERAMSGGQAVGIEWLSAGGVLALPIMGCNDPLAAIATGVGSG